MPQFQLARPAKNYFTKATELQMTTLMILIGAFLWPKLELELELELHISTPVRFFGPELELELDLELKSNSGKTAGVRPELQQISMHVRVLPW